MRGFRFLAALAAVPFVLVPASVLAQDAPTKTGYVAAVGEGTVLVSNVPIGQGGGRMMMVPQEGVPPPPPPAGAQPAAAGEARAGTAGEKKPGEAGEDKVVPLRREGAEKMKGLWVQADPSAKPAQRTEGADEKVAFTEFQVTSDTVRPADLAPGTKVKVTYTVEGEKKVARRIEIVKE